MPAPRGTFIWYDVMTTDTKAAAKFYGDVIGWSTQEHPMADGGTYTILSNGPRMVAGLMAIPEPVRAQGVPPCWSGYLATDDVDADAKRVAAAGGAIQRPPTDIPNVGRFAVVADPGGAVFLLFKPNTTEEPQPVAPMTPGHVAWHELYAGDLDREFSFYSRIFGWTKDRAHDMGPMGTYQTFATGGAPCGGMTKAIPQVSPPGWNYYTAVASVAAAADRALTRGAKLLHGPAEVPGGAWIVQARDPQGAAFALVSAQK
jgi:uncharacterized protein